MNRLTERDEYGNADIIGVDSEDFQLNLDFEGFNRVTEALNRLAAYEDTGLEPEECAKYAQAEKEGRYIVLKEPRSAGVHRLEEIARADIEGRLLVLPCKVGDMAYFRRGRDIIGDIVGRIVLDGMNQVLVGAHNVFIFRDFGKTVFLTREDAEKALGGMKNDHRID